MRRYQFYTQDLKKIEIIKIKCKFYITYSLVIIFNGEDFRPEIIPLLKFTWKISALGLSWIECEAR